MKTFHFGYKTKLPIFHQIKNIYLFIRPRPS